MQAQCVGHCSRSREVVRELVTWKPKRGDRRPGRSSLIYPKQLASEFGITVVDLGGTDISEEAS